MTAWSNTISANLVNRMVGEAIAGTAHLEELENAKAQLLTTAANLSHLYREQRSQAEELERVMHELRATHLATVETLAFAVETKDECTRNHLERCRYYGMTLARKIDPDLVTDQLEYGFLLHDVGKLGVPERILLKPGVLTPDEMRIVQTHTIYGVEIIAPLKDFLGNAISVIRHHHERYDGRGYPDGLKKEEIPREARLFAVVDAFDAMTSDRPYRSALSFEVARERLRLGAGGQFDPVMVEEFEDIVGRFIDN